MKTFRYRAAIVVGLSAIALSISATPAFAVSAPPPLPTGSSMYAVNCDDTAPDLQLFSLDSATAIATSIGTGTSIDSANCGGQPAWDAVTSTAYYVVWPNGSHNESLATLNLSTGASTKVADFSLGANPHNVDAIAIGSGGAAYALSNGKLYSLNLATAVLTLIGTTGSQTFGFSFDPISAEFFTINSSGLISTIDVATGTLTSVGSVGFNHAAATYSLQIDTNGLLWIENDNGSSIAEIWSVNRANVATSGILSGNVKLATVNTYTEALLLVPGQAVVPAVVAPTLASTGVDSTRLDVLAASAFAALFIGGSALIIARKRRGSIV